ncbi:hypothetical protein PENTCL1PPCAC_15979, partial [Pristionchus entomophagus]
MQARRDQLTIYFLKYVPQYVKDQDKIVGELARPALLWTLITCASQSFVNIAVGRAIFKLASRYTVQNGESQNWIYIANIQALAVQAVIGQLIAFAGLSYGLGQFDLVRSVILEYTTHMVHEFCISSSPIITLFFVKPYR